MVSAPSAAFWRENLFAARFSAAASAMAMPGAVAPRLTSSWVSPLALLGAATKRSGRGLKLVFLRALGLAPAPLSSSIPSCAREGSRLDCASMSSVLPVLKLDDGEECQTTFRS